MYMGRALSSGLSVSRGLSGRQWRWHPNACAAFVVFAAVVRNKDQPKSELSMDRQSLYCWISDVRTWFLQFVDIRG